MFGEDIVDVKRLCSVTKMIDNKNVKTYLTIYIIILCANNCFLLKPSWCYMYQQIYLEIHVIVSYNQLGNTYIVYVKSITFQAEVTYGKLCITTNILWLLLTKK